MLLAAYPTAEREGMDAINRVWDRDKLWAGEPEKTPERFARFLTDRTDGLWPRMPARRSRRLSS
jgi:hypothetical protein